MATAPASSLKRQSSKDNTSEQQVMKLVVVGDGDDGSKALKGEADRAPARARKQEAAETRGGCWLVPAYMRETHASCWSVGTCG